jgi:hypothetical protein
MIYSSKNPENLALTIKGLLMSLLPILILLTQKYGLSEEQIVEGITALSIVVSALVTLWGLLRKIYLWNRG